ncbi:bifunctional ADP-dependent NAD(P)H-hydrate dehydratase/NAD(P)H-hydrate epimerase [Butyrivibrio sp. VCB2006]|uniref:bifunctional ADP-dependent NAD(P)H-hydrate dehydratase/NAD(P)H-hydrate epimerase n=1 Tax=Butyrivibrio sp. VCB2006 TaxID=1280679 RepID=UPI00041E208A|nr:bifunctional ADP-dependent NAD(P)H-hydrate dehydratase/NAD(P)H-hydrate epimerase [Butyrivibrio sp. VCB2006]
MRYAVNSQEMKIYDRNTSEIFGVESCVLMERASLKVVENIERWIASRNIERKVRALVIAGVGNNGGDGACIARLLKQKGIIVSICIIGDFTKCTDLLLGQLKILEKYGVAPDTFSNIRDNKSPAEWDIIVDAMFGIGLSRPVTGDFAEAVRYINDCKEERKSDILVTSVDMPSGINADNGKLCEVAVKADMTITFNQVKLGHILYPGCEYTGRLIVEDAGITEDSFLSKEPHAFFYDEDIKALLPERILDANKGTNGKVLIIAGSKDVSGACILAANACLKAGAGMVKIFTASENAEVIKALMPEAMLVTYQDFEAFNEKLKLCFDWASTVVLGPGIGTAQSGFELVKQTLEEYTGNLVVDADALTLVSRDHELRNLLSNYARSGRKLVLTPHLGEFARLFDRDIRDCKEHILEYPTELARNLHCTVICKDARTVIADSKEKKIYINMSGNDGMATAGSGDVLAGIIGAFMAFGKTSFEIACLSVYLHGLAGDKAASEKGKHSMVATDIIQGMEEILSKI